MLIAVSKLLAKPVLLLLLLVQIYIVTSIGWGISPKLPPTQPTEIQIVNFYEWTYEYTFFIASPAFVQLTKLVESIDSSSGQQQKSNKEKNNNKQFHLQNSTTLSVWPLVCLLVGWLVSRYYYCCCIADVVLVVVVVAVAMTAAAGAASYVATDMALLCRLLIVFSTHIFLVFHLNFYCFLLKILLFYKLVGWWPLLPQKNNSFIVHWSLTYQHIQRQHTLTHAYPFIPSHTKSVKYIFC